MQNKAIYSLIQKLTYAIVFILLLAPSFTLAVIGPVQNWTYPFSEETMSAQSYLVLDRQSGQVLLSKNPNQPNVPASLTKLLAAMVVLDSGVDLNKEIAMQKIDEVGGVRLSTKSGVKYKIGDLLRAALITSANNAAHAISRSVYSSEKEFVDAMNRKAKKLGAINSIFVEPTGMSAKNITTASDFIKIASAAFNNPEIQKITKMPSYTFASTNNKRYKHTVKTTNNLLKEGSWMIIAAKTGYLAEAGHNFAAGLKDVDGKEIIIVLFGSKSTSAQFMETKRLALWSWLNYKWPMLGQVAGANILNISN